MINLLNANFTRLKKNKLFWLLIGFSIVMSLLMIGSKYKDMKTYNDIIEVEQILLNYSVIIGIVISIFTSLFLGVEYSDGGLRNKISIGHNRLNIYLSNLITVLITSLFSYLLFIIITMCIGIPLFGSITISLKTLLILLGCLFLVVIAYSSIFTFIAMICSNKTITSIVNIMLAFGMMFYSLMAYDTLSQPEYIDSLIIKSDTEERVIEPTKNPHYLTGIKKKLVKLSIDINPSGQTLQIAGRTVTNLKVLPLYSLGLTVFFTGIGIIIFNKKELK
ncbi:MAG: ABC transporter permease [Ruminococcus sp.]|nr:ABC transporter permease [Ruminococcus sp.]